MPNRPEYLAIWLGVAKVGGVVALLNTNLSGAALAHCIAVAAPGQSSSPPNSRPAYAEAAPHLAAPPKVWLHGEAALTADAHRSGGRSARGRELPAFEAPRRELADRALCIYTSGTTGLPKAANVSHHRIMMWSAWFAGLADITADDRMYDCLPMYHSVGGIVAIGAALVNGGSVAIEERFSARQFWDDVARWDCSLFQYIGELCRYLSPRRRIRPKRAHRLRLACGNGLSPEVWRAFQRRFAIPRILEFYAATEGNFSLYNVEGKVGAIGRTPRLPDGAQPGRAGAVRFRRRPAAARRRRLLRALRGRRARRGDRADVARWARPGARFEGYTSAADTEKKILRDVFAPGDAWYAHAAT